RGTGRHPASQVAPSRVAYHAPRPGLPQRTRSDEPIGAPSTSRARRPPTTSPRETQSLGYPRALPGETMKTRAAVAFEAKKPLEIVELDLEGPKPGEVMVELKATGICHTDDFTMSGADPEGLFPAVLGHEGAGVVVEVGAGVRSVQPGDHVIPLYTPE